MYRMNTRMQLLLKSFLLLITQRKQINSLIGIPLCFKAPLEKIGYIFIRLTMAYRSITENALDV